MFAWTSHGTELKRFAKAPITRAAIVVLLLIPLLYGAMYVWAFKSPTDRLDQLPVALVNEDQGATSQGKELKAGQQVVDKLIDKHPLGWHLVSAQDAAAGVTSGEYYFAVTIPKDFSESLASAGGSSPHAASISVTYDDTNSFLASTLGKSAMSQIRTVVSESAGEQAADTLLVGLGDVRKGLGNASDGAFRLKDGLTTAKEGADKLNLAAVQLNNGATQVNDGAHQLADGIAQAAAQTPQLADGVTQLSAGSQELSTALDTLNAKMPTLTSSSQQLASGAQQVASGSSQLNAGLSQLQQQYGAAAAGASSLADGSAKLSSGITSLNQLSAAANAALAAGDTATAQGYLAKINALTAATGPIGGGAASLNAGASQLSSGLSAGQPKVDALAAGAAKLDSGAAALSTGASAMSDGAAQLADGVSQIDAGGHKLNGGVGQLAAKIPALVDGINALNTGAQQLADGTAKLNDGTTQLKDKTPELVDGTQQLTDGAGQLGAELKKGQDQIPNDSTTLREERAKTVSSPVELGAEYVNQAGSWGEGFAPFFISLALWVGCLITWLLLRPLQTRALMTSVNGFRTAWGSLNPALLLAIGQVLIMLTVMHFAIGIKIANVAATVGITLLICFAFMALQQFLQIAFGSAAGKVIIIVFLMVQLASCSGTYPIETEPGFLRAINPFMPMTYSVIGMREAITGGVDGRFWLAVAIMGTILVTSLIGSSIACTAKRTWTVSRLHPALSL
ncbi:MAG: YhgE/Pip family protein [Propionibacteriaceae bacterium]